ncbi:MAG TPA: isoleucine--tRNA ligase [Thermomicrobiales bacterium]|nr:isoleucine--tRNA ligase [Thermomicrobiales bacterium]
MQTTTTPTFKDVPSKVDFPAMERDLLRYWEEQRVVAQYLVRNEDSDERFSFIDGPITANNPMGVHHGWGRTYKDIFQRYQAGLGKKQRFQNGFDCQGLWVEVEVEKELGLKNKREIEAYGVAEFVERCKQRVWKYAARQTEQSIRLGYWMDWDNSYYTMSDENNYTIWHFLKTCHERNWIYKGHDVMPWCPRCGTGLSELEIVTEGYQHRTHLAIYAAFPLTDDDASLLIWTTTPWTLAANVAAAVNPDLIYVKVQQDGRRFYVAQNAVGTAIRGEHEVLEACSGADLVGKTFTGPFDELPAASDVTHRVIAWKDVDSEEGTGIVHIAPGCGKEDYALSKEFGLDVLGPINEFGVYQEGYAWLSGREAHDVARDIEANLKDKGLWYRSEQYTHRYPVCWRCGTDLLFRLVDEWFIRMDELRPQLMDATRTARWIPSFGMDREIDWLANMDDWMISKKRYWGLALPIFDCTECGTFEVIGSEAELKERAISGWDEFKGHTPHRPYVDSVRIACSGCGSPVSRIPDVGNPWLDAGIVALSTLEYRHDREYWEQWYPADLITESFPGQFRNWFYALIAESTALTGRAPFRNVFTYALMRDEKGAEMHKSKGNAIWFDDAADDIGVDTMRWLFATVNPSTNLAFGYNVTDEVRRRFILPLWNSYSFFVTYARIDGWVRPEHPTAVPDRSLLDRWILSRASELVALVRERMDDYDIMSAARAIEFFVVEELSNWYIRRNRRRFWKPESDSDKSAAYETLYDVLVMVSNLIAPILPFTSEAMYQNLVRSLEPSAPTSVHLQDFPSPDATVIDPELSRAMSTVLEVVRLGRSARSEVNIKTRQPLPAILVFTADPANAQAVVRLKDQILDELNVNDVRAMEDLGDVVSHDIRPNLPILGPKYGKRLGAIRGALSGMDPVRVARSVEAGMSIDLSLPDGKSISLEPSEILVTLQKREGYAAAQSEAATVVLDTTLTPELVQEGLARDVVRAIQDARKQLALDIDDRIVLALVGSEAITRAVGAYAEYVKREVLADDLRIASEGDQAETGWLDVKVGPETIRLRIDRAG